MTAVASPVTVRTLSQLLMERTGQQIVPSRTWRIDAALRPLLRQRGVGTVEALVAKLKEPGSDALATQIVEALLNNESSFFRDPAMFDLLASEALPRLIAARSSQKLLRIWSAGCSLGQEAYTLAILCKDLGDMLRDWTVEIVATDVSSHAIARARAARYTQFEIQRGLPVRTMISWFTQVDDEWFVDPRIRRLVRFSTHNILDMPPGRFDLVLCRNVLMYFNAADRARAFGRIASAIADDGLLMLGAGETILGQTDAFTTHPALRGLYRPTPQAMGRAA